MSKRVKRAKSEMDPIRELHKGQRRVTGRINRSDTRKHLDYAPALIPSPAPPIG